MNKLAAAQDEVLNADLSEALEKKTEFTQEEWEAFGITALRMGHFIKAGDKFFQPAGIMGRRREEPASGLKWKEAGAGKPGNGLTSKELSEALGGKLDFTQKDRIRVSLRTPPGLAEGGVSRLKITLKSSAGTSSAGTGVQASQELYQIPTG